MKKLSVVFIIYKNYVLLGKQAPGKRLAGFRNGYGGKAEGNESTLDCALRELQEEIDLEKNYGIKVRSEDLEEIGKVLMDEKEIDFFVLRLKEKINPPKDNDEFVDTTWFDLAHPEKFVGEMLSGDEKVVAGLRKFLEDSSKFVVDKTGDQVLRKQVKDIY